MPRPPNNSRCSSQSAHFKCAQTFRRLTPKSRDNTLETEMVLPIRLTLLTLGVADVARATLFYEKLGLVRSPASNDNVSFFDVGGVVLSIYGREAIAADAGIDNSGAGFRGSSIAWNLRSQEDVDKAIVKMVAAGGSLVKAAERTFWGGYAGFVADPDGHLWEVAHNPGFPLDDEQRLRLPA